MGSMPKLRNKSMRYRFLAIVMILAAGSLSSCQQSSMSSTSIVNQSQAMPLQKWQGFPLRHAVLRVPR
jgi:hypothetical protein